MLIQGDRIIEIGQHLDPPADAQIIDCTGQSILPGLIDMHGHLWGVTGIGRETHFATFPSLYLAAGVTTIFSPGELDPEGAIVLREAIKAGEKVGPRILPAGPYFDHASTILPWVNGLETVGDARAQFRAWKDRIDGMSELWPEGTHPADLDCALAYLNLDGDKVKNLIRQIGQRSTDLLLEDMQTAIKKIMVYIEDMDQQGFAADEKTIDAVFRNFFTLGKAAGQILQSFREQHPNILWDMLSYYQNLVYEQY